MATAASRIQDLYYLPTDHLIGDDSEETVDCTHPTDVGFERMLKIIGRQMKEWLDTNWTFGQFVAKLQYSCLIHEPSVLNNFIICKYYITIVRKMEDINLWLDQPKKD